MTGVEIVIENNWLFKIRKMLPDFTHRGGEFQ